MKIIRAGRGIISHMENENEEATPLQGTPSEIGAEEDLEDTKPRRITRKSDKQVPAPEDQADTVRITEETERKEGATTLPLASLTPEATPEVFAEDAAKASTEAPAEASAGAEQPLLETPSLDEEIGIEPKPVQKPNRRWIWISLAGLAALLLIALVSAVGGYSSGISLRRSAEKTQLASAAQEQFELGLKDMEQGNYFRARQRFEYVIQVDPNYPGAVEKLAEALLQLNTTATPTPVPTPTVTPTPDLRTVQELFDQAQQALLDKDWTKTIDTLLALRKADASYRMVEVDDMFYVALRNRGMDKIIKEADLEGGVYDLTLASHFGPLDAEAKGMLNWVTLYITGASFWGIDWEQAVNYFSQVAPQMPHLRDKSGMSASERYRVALIEYGNQLAQQGQYCKAVQQYQTVLQLYGPDPEVEATLNAALKACGQSEQPKPTGEKPTKKPKTTPTPTP